MTSNGYGTFLKTIEGQPIETIVEEALRITQGDRNDDYGPPLVDLGNIGRSWAATLSNHLGQEIPDIPAHVVALLMIQLKCIRYAHRPKHDSLVDMVGYALCVEQSRPDPSQEA